MQEKVEAVVIGAGVAGLAAARRLALAGLEVIVLEQHDLIGSETSSRNSEVIHAGIYYPPDSLKAKTCVAGKQFLYDYCSERGIDYRKSGKLIVATQEAQVEKLLAIRKNAQASQVTDLELLDQKAAQQLEPEVSCVAAIFSPSTGIVDSHALMLSFQADLENAGGMVCLKTKVSQLSMQEDGTIIKTEGDEQFELNAGIVINAAGLDAISLRNMALGPNRGEKPKVPYFCKGNYFVLEGRSPFSRPVYPVPEKDGLGIHATVDLAGCCRFGPDVQWVDQKDYLVDSHREETFRFAIQTYWPGIEERILQPGYAGIRPKLNGPERKAADFTIEKSYYGDRLRLIHLLGIESPGLTASAALADLVFEWASN